MTVSGRIIVYNAPCAGETYIPIGGTPTMIEIAKLTVDARLMSNKEVKEAVDYASKAIGILKSLTGTGKAVMDFLKNKYEDVEDTLKTLDKWKNGFAVVGGLADILKGIFMFFPEPENPLVGELQKLADTVDELGRKVSENFKEAKALITEINFISQILSPCFVLNRYMINVIKNPGPRTRENFERVYKRHSPIKLLYKLMSYLEQDTTNPLRVAMDSEKIKTKATFEKWENVFYRMMGQLMFLEAFGSGIMGIKDQTSFDLIAEKSMEVFKQLQKWRAEYEKNKDDSYWKEVKGFFEDYMTNSTDKTNSEKADELQKKMDNYFTTDSFYIVIFNQGSLNKDHAYYCFDVNENLIGSWNKGRCNAYIYRTRTAHEKLAYEFKNLEGEVEICRYGRLSYNGTLKDVIKNQLLDKNLFVRSGFVSLVWRETDPQFRSANCAREWGPGWWITCDMKDVRKKATYEYRLLASFE